LNVIIPTNTPERGRTCVDKERVQFISRTLEIFILKKNLTCPLVIEVDDLIECN